MSLYQELLNISPKKRISKYKLNNRSKSNLEFQKFNLKDYSIENEKELLFRKINKIRTVKNHISSLKKFPSNNEFRMFSSKKNANSISVEDRKNLKKINNKENTIEINSKSIDYSFNKINNIKNNLQKSLDNYIGKMNKKIEEYEKKKYDLFNLNYKFSKGKIKNNISGLYNLKNGNKLKTNKSTTFLFKKEKPQENILRRLLSMKQNNSSLKLAIKAQTIKWLWLHKSIIIEQLIFYFQNYRWFIDKNKFIDKKILEEFLIVLNFKKDKIFIDNIFLLFDYEKKGFIDFKKVLFSLIINSNSNYQQKIRLFLNLLKNENDNKINIQELNDLFIYTIPYNERKYIMNLIRENLGMKEINVLIDDSLIFNFLSSDLKIYNVFKKYFFDFDDITNNVDNEINNAYMGIMKNSKNSLFGKNINTFVLNDLKKLDKVINSVKQNMDFKENIQKNFSFEKE